MSKTTAADYIEKLEADLSALRAQSSSNHEVAALRAQNQALETKLDIAVRALNQMQETVDDDGMGGWLTDLINDTLEEVE